MACSKYLVTVGTDGNHTMIDAGTGWPEETNIITAVRAGMALKYMDPWGWRREASGRIGCTWWWWFNGGMALFSRMLAASAPPNGAKHQAGSSRIRFWGSNH